MVFEPRNRTIPRTFRIDQLWDDELKTEAEKLGITTSQLINTIIRWYLIYWRYAEKDSRVVLSNLTLEKFFSKLNDKEISEIAYQIGLLLTPDFLKTYGLDPNIKNVKWYLENWGELGGWFKLSFYEKQENYVMYLKHDHGWKWSIFIASYIKSMFKAVLDTDITCETTLSAATLIIPKKRGKLFQ